MEYISRLVSSLPMLTAGTPAGDGGGQTSFLPTLLTFGLVFVVFYFLIIRPQNKRQRESKAMLANLAKGDRVATAGGIHGTIHSLKKDVVILKIDTNTMIELSRGSVSRVVEKGGAKAVESKSTKSDAASSEQEEASQEVDSSD